MQTLLLQALRLQVLAQRVGRRPILDRGLLRTFASNPLHTYLFVGRRPILDRGLLLGQNCNFHQSILSTVGRRPILDRGLLPANLDAHTIKVGCNVGRRPILDRGLLHIDRLWTFKPCVIRRKTTNPRQGITTSLTGELYTTVSGRRKTTNPRQGITTDDESSLDRRTGQSSEDDQSSTGDYYLFTVFAIVSFDTTGRKTTNPRQGITTFHAE